jgi:hypothetical protein
VNELGKMVWAAAYARSFAEKGDAREALIDAQSAVWHLETYRVNNQTSHWLPEELRS